MRRYLISGNYRQTVPLYPRYCGKKKCPSKWSKNHYQSFSLVSCFIVFKYLHVKHVLVCLIVVDDSLLESLMTYLQEHYKDSQPDPSATFRVGQPVIALYDDDKQYYRAVVTDIVGDQLKVLFVSSTHSIVSSS